MPSEAVHRVTARVIPVNERDEVLLLRGHDPARPGREYWFTVGGALEPGESFAAAAVRETHEETGLIIAESEVGLPFHEGVHEFSYDNTHYVSHSRFYAVRVSSGSNTTLDHLETAEVGNIFEARWHQISDVHGLPLSNDELPDVARLAVESLQP